MNKTKTILIISTLDTKAKETDYLRQEIINKRYNTILMDIGMAKESPLSVDISARQIAEASGSSIEDIRNSNERDKITAKMIKGAINKVRGLESAGKFDGVIGIGGSTGSLMITSIMRALPFGIPKFMVSSTAALPGLSSRYFGTGDITIMNTVIEISGLNNLLKNLLSMAANAICGMVETVTLSLSSITDKDRPLIAMSQTGGCEQCATYVYEHLGEKGFQVIGFSASGVADRAMEDIIGQGFFQGVIELAPGGVGEEMVGGMRAAGSNRLETAGEKGIPQVIAPCIVNLMSPPKSKYKPEYKTRKKYDIDALRTLIRLSPEEISSVAEVFAYKLNKATGPVIFLVPLHGWSSIDREGSQIYEPETDRIFLDKLKKLVKPQIKIREIEANIEDPEFGSSVVEAFEEVFLKTPPI